MFVITSGNKTTKNQDKKYIFKTYIINKGVWETVILDTIGNFSISIESIYTYDALIPYPAPSEKIKEQYYTM